MSNCNWFMKSTSAIQPRSQKSVEQTGSGDVTLATIAEHVEQIEGGEPIDRQWLQRVTSLLTRVEKTEMEIRGGNHRAAAGLEWESSTPQVARRSGAARIRLTPIRSRGQITCSRIRHRWRWVSLKATCPRWQKDSKPFAWRNWSLPMNTNRRSTMNSSAYFNWQQFTDEEWELCPPVVAVGGDGAMYDIGFQNLSRAYDVRQTDQSRWSSTRKFIPTPAVRPARPVSLARFRTWPNLARPSRASRKFARRLD